MIQAQIHGATVAPIGKVILHQPLGGVCQQLHADLSCLHQKAAPLLRSLEKQEPWYLHTALRRVGLGLFGFQALGNGKQIGEKESVNHSQLLALC